MKAHLVPILVGFVAVASSCADSPTTARTDLRAYLQRTKDWAPVEAETNRTITRIFQTQFVDEPEVLRQIAASRPRVQEHLESVRSFLPRSDALERLHAGYVRAWQDLLQGYTAIEEGFASGDHTKLARGREALEGWRAAIEHMARELRRLAEHFGVEPGGAVETRASGGATHST